MTPANESGLPLPEEPEPLSDAPMPDDLPGPRSTAGRAGTDGGGADPDAAPDGGALEAAAERAESDAGSGAGVDAAADAEAEAARERAVFDELVASFHTETAPDPQPRKIIRYPVLNTEPVWDEPILEPSDETTVEKYFPDEHYEPPEPPPLPDASGATKASWTLLIGGVLFLVCRTLFQWNTEEWTFWLGVFAVFGGIISLVARMRPDRDDYDDPDHGAVV